MSAKTKIDWLREGEFN